MNSLSKVVKKGCFFLTLLMIGCTRVSEPLENQFFGCTLGQATEAEVMAAMAGDGHECRLHREGAMLGYGNVPFGGSVWESVSFFIENDTLTGVVFSDERRLPYAVQMKRFNEKYARYGGVDGDGYRYSDGKTQIEINYSEAFPGTSLIYRTRTSSSWRAW